MDDPIYICEKCCYKKTCVWKPKESCEWFDTSFSKVFIFNRSV